MAPVLRSHTRDGREEATLPPTFHFSRLPMEIQLYVLRYSLPEEESIVNFGRLLPRAPELIEDEDFRRLGPIPPASPKSITKSTHERERVSTVMAILSTCHLFRTEGWRYLVKTNNFTHILEAGTQEMSRFPRAWDLVPAKFRNLTSMTLKEEHICYYQRRMETVFLLFECVAHMPALRTLGLEFSETNPLYDLDEGIRFRHGKTIDKCRSFCQEYIGFRHDEKRGLAMASRLDEVKLVGIENDDFGYLFVWIASWLLKPGRHMRLEMIPPPSWASNAGKGTSEEKSFASLERKEVKAWVMERLIFLGSWWNEFIIPFIEEGPYKRNFTEKTDSGLVGL
ncbi:hypothetical protein G7Y79_00002g007210 [Physcia stellaris]|nr:hypothetical protein G7Y79_00002g007210 [Physcia stellaris]